MVTDIVRNMGWFGNTTDAIVVGIGYPENPNPQVALCDSIARRFHDFTPVRDVGVEKWVEELVKRPALTGGADGFLGFIQHELIPVIERDFPIDPQKRILVGHSIGGTFAAYALFEEPNLFDSYVIGSPNLAYGDRFIFKREALYAKRHKKLAAKVHLWVGEHEELPDDPGFSEIIRFEAILESRKYKGLKFVKQIFADLHHSEVIAPGFLAGLRMALRP
jgi:predicted alpha/beta superfamily hydrolase